MRGELGAAPISGNREEQGEAAGASHPEIDDGESGSRKGPDSDVQVVLARLKECEEVLEMERAEHADELQQVSLAFLFSHSRTQTLIIRRCDVTHESIGP